MPSMTTEIAIIIVLIAINGIFTMSEMAIVSARRTRLQEWSAKGSKAAQAALDIVEAPNDFLSTVQIGITLIGILTGTFGGATIAEQLSDQFMLVPTIKPYADTLAIAVVVSVITYLTLILGELVPKRLALHSPEVVAKNVAVLMRFISIATKPLVWFVSSSTDFVLRLLNLESSAQINITEAEIHHLVDEASKAGIVEESEQEMVTKVLRLGVQRVTAVMTPRTEVVWLDSESALDGILTQIDGAKHDWFPVAQGTLDSVLGVVNSKTILSFALQGQPIRLDQLAVKPLYVPENITALQLLERFRAEREQMAFVIDEYGGFQGLITSEDIFQAIVGDLSVKGVMPKWEIERRDDRTWIFDGQVPIEEFRKTFSLEILPDEEEIEYETLAGFVINYLQRIPDSGELFEWQGLSFEILDLKWHKINKIVVRKTN
ncbi:MAG: hemolysin family protein [Candidatus Obscuribacterales bacterium]|nr:hemolysin family protein [Candidatus Obscuribacterales bacterium]